VELSGLGRPNGQNAAFGQENALLRGQKCSFVTLTTPVCGSVTPDVRATWQYDLAVP
jgi:hypothetical protein